MKQTLGLSALLAVGLWLTGTCGASAQQAPRILGENHAMLSLDSQGGRYLLLPVEERAENANLRVVGRDNNVVQRLNVRLAVDAVDYYVPMEVKDGQTLDIIFHGDRRTTGAVKDFACWREMKRSETFDTANRERLRPLWHHTPAYGWMNDPNGMFYWPSADGQGGEWHLCYQWNPYGSQWENMTWGHSVSRDLIHWETLPAAIVPDGLGTIFSGSCVVDREGTAGYGAGAVIAFYTSAAEAQTQSMAYSTDGGRTFTKYEHNPIITADVPDFRDPNVFWYEPTRRWVMLLAAGQEMRIYTSANLRDWRYESAFGSGYGSHSGVWECPDLFPLTVGTTGQQKWVLLCNINPGGPSGGSATQYFVGQFDGHSFTCESRPDLTKWMDYGKDHYAAVTFDNAPAGRRVSVGWMSNWQYANQVPTRQFRSANCAPRDLSLFDDGGETYLASLPSPEVDALRGGRLSAPTESCEIDVDVKGSAEVVLSNGVGEQVCLTYDAAARTLTMDRRGSGDMSFSEAFSAVTTAPTHGAVRRLRILVDRCSLEVFDAEGRVAMANLVFPSEPYGKVKVKGGRATVYQLRAQQ